MPEQEPTDPTQQDQSATPPGAPGTDPETNNSAASQAFKRRIDAELQTLESTATKADDLKAAREKVETRSMPMLRPGVVLAIIDLLVIAITFLVIFTPTVIIAGIIALVLWLSGIDPTIVSILLLVPAVPAILAPIPYTLYQFDNLFAEVKSDEGAVLRYFETPIHQMVNGEPAYVPISGRYVLAPRPVYSVSSYSLDPDTNEITERKVVVQRLSEESESVTPEQDADPTENLETEEKSETEEAPSKSSIVTFGGNYTLNPDGTDFRSLILLYDFNGGIKAATKRIEKAIARAMQRYCSGPDGPLNQEQAIAIGGFLKRALEVIVHKDLAECGVNLATMAPSIEPPDVQIQAIEKANIEKPQRAEEEGHALTTARSYAISMTGNPNMTDEEVMEVMKKYPPPPDLMMLMVGKKNKTLNDESSFSIKKIDSNSPLLGTVEAVKEVFNG